MRLSSAVNAVSAVACLALVACAADAEPTDPAPTATTQVATPPSLEASQAHSAPATPGAAPARAFGSDLQIPGPQENPVGFVCRPGAFCEDFEQQGFARRWASSLTTGSGSIESGTASASLGRRSLRLFTADDSSSAYLVEDKGIVKGQWSGVLGFAFRIDAVPSKYLGGPELTMQTADGPMTVRLSVAPEGVFVEQLSTAECLHERCVPKRTLVAQAHPSDWYRVTLGFEVNPANGGSYGRLEISVDDSGVVVSTDLTVPFYDGALTLNAGITQGDVGRRSLADLDDVTLLVR